MPLRKPAKTANRDVLEQFADKYDALAILYGDPVEFLFKVMASSDYEVEVKASAAKTLMDFRYPKVKAAELEDSNKQPQLTMSIVVQQALPGARTIVDVSPRSPVLKLPATIADITGEDA